MKKIFLSLLFTAVVLTAKAQDETMKADAGNVTLEVGLAPLGDSPISLGNNLIRGRYFLGPGTAIRAGLGLTYAESRPDDNTINTNSGFTIRPGIEKHYTGTGRLSPYLGAELELTSRGSKRVERISGREYVIRNENGFTRLGMGLVAGADYYFTRHAYLGVEFGYGFGYQKNKDIIRTDNDPVRGGSSFYIGQGVNSLIRLGFVLF